MLKKKIIKSKKIWKIGWGSVEGKTSETCRSTHGVGAVSLSTTGAAALKFIYISDFAAYN